MRCRSASKSGEIGYGRISSAVDEPKLLTVSEKTLVGTRIRTSLAESRGGEIWRALRSQAAEVSDRVGTDFYSVRVYDPEYSFTKFDAAARFDKWAAVEVYKDPSLPDGFESHSIPVGQYAVFICRGTPAMASNTFGFVFGTWLREADFDLDDRPHFEILDNNWNPFDESANEEVWVPIKPREK